MRQRLEARQHRAKSKNNHGPPADFLDLASVIGSASLPLDHHVGDVLQVFQDLGGGLNGRGQCSGPYRLCVGLFGQLDVDLGQILAGFEDLACVIICARGGGQGYVRSGTEQRGDDA